MVHVEQPAIVLQLPWPPSVNRYWRSVKGRVLISRDGREYRVDVQQHVRAQLPSLGTPENGRLEVVITAYPPDRRRRDLDNMLKATLDALQHAGVIADDGDIDRLAITRGQVQECGRLLVQIRPMECIAWD